ncbi:MAG: hypothetical protein KC619_17120 [Myxococcales bacterium]|nr:hypothetical protein [Myxococcales bacterium]
MPFEDWSDWRQVAETFVAERPPSDPALIVEALVLVLTRVGSWADFLGGGWVHHAPTELYIRYVPGFGAARTFRLLDRLVGWLHGRGDLDDWQRDVLLTVIDDARDCRRLDRVRDARVEELRFHDYMRSALLAELAETLDDAEVRARLPRIVGPLVTALEAQHGPSSAPPLGSLDPEALVAVLAASRRGDGVAEAELLALLGVFYAWLGKTGRLERTRAEDLAARLALGAMGVASPADAA